jgi:glycosyltransferase involved in cell wall biosynthesis
LSASTPFVSVVLPAYRRAGVVRDAMESVLRQTYSRFELVVIDDGSGDDTPAVVSSVRDPRVRVAVIDHAGRSQARNEGVSRARGEVIAFLDSDDLVKPRWLESLCRPFADPAVAVVCCGAEMIGDAGSPRALLPEKLGAVYSNQVGRFLAGTFAVRRQTFDAVGGYDRRFAFGENSELGIRLAMYCDAHGRTIAAVREPLLQIRRQRAFGGDAEFREHLESSELLLRCHAPRFRGSSRAHIHAAAGVEAARLRLHGRALRHMARAAYFDPARPVHWARLALALMPPVAQRFWTRQRDSRGSAWP